MTAQEPIGSGFSKTTTAEEALGGRDLRGKIAIVTGAASGIGRETARVLTKAGATVIAPVRTPEKGRVALADLPSIEIAALDLMDPDSIDAFAQRFLASGRPLHILINNAGLMACPLTRDGRGNEAQLSTNHLGHFQLTARLWPALAREGARVVELSSGAHRRAAIDFDDVNWQTRPYDKWAAYGASKTANALFAVGLDARGKAHKVRAFSAHPGVIQTELSRHLAREELQAAGWYDEKGQIKADMFKSVAQGAATSVWCAANPRLENEGGVYCEDVEIAEAVPADKPTAGGVRPWAIDPASADRLWSLSEAMTGLRFKP
ncbi:MAG: oxidoreductase [Hyphomonadaceae bacterium]